MAKCSKTLVNLVYNVMLIYLYTGAVMNITYLLYLVLTSRPILTTMLDYVTV